MIKSGVYKITSKVDGRAYVGSTIVPIELRIARHKRELRKNIHKNKKLQNHYNKYGGDCFEYTILIRCAGGLRVVRDFENYFIGKYKASEDEFGFNIMKDAVSWEGFKHSEESKKKCLAAVLKNALKSRKPVVGICPSSGNIVKRYNSVSEGSKLHPGISQSINGKAFFADGLIWRHEKDFKDFDLNKFNNLFKNTRYKSNIHSIQQRLLDLETGIYYDNLKEASQAMGYTEKQYPNFTIRLKSGYYNDKFLKV